jgi:hypothetical protein
MAQERAVFLDSFNGGFAIVAGWKIQPFDLNIKN